MASRRGPLNLTAHADSLSQGQPSSQPMEEEEEAEEEEEGEGEEERGGGGAGGRADAAAAASTLTTGSGSTNCHHSLSAFAQALNAITSTQRDQPPPPAAHPTQSAAERSSHAAAVAALGVLPPRSPTDPLQEYFKWVCDKRAKLGLTAEGAAAWTFTGIPELLVELAALRKLGYSNPSYAPQREALLRRLLDIAMPAWTRDEILGAMKLSFYKDLPCTGATYIQLLRLRIGPVLQASQRAINSPLPFSGGGLRWRSFWRSLGLDKGRATQLRWRSAVLSWRKAKGYSLGNLRTLGEDDEALEEAAGEVGGYLGARGNEGEEEEEEERGMAALVFVLANIGALDKGRATQVKYLCAVRSWLKNIGRDLDYLLALGECDLVKAAAEVGPRLVALRGDDDEEEEDRGMAALLFVRNHRCITASGGALKQRRQKWAVHKVG